MDASWPLQQPARPPARRQVRLLLEAVPAAGRAGYADLRDALGRTALLEVCLGLGRIVALYHRSST
jgi:hypothetical protein